jgi:hypothetical protein
MSKKLTIEGNSRYINYLKNHLEEEHPKTRGKIRIK